MATKREYLISLGLAKEGRGRFSREALDALAKAEADGMIFDETVVTPVKTEKTVKVKIVGAKPPTSEDFSDLSPKAVRDWAVKNPNLLPAGVTVGSRGRIDLRVFAAYKSNVKDVVTRADEPEDNGKIIMADPIRTFPAGQQFKGTKNGKTVIIDDRQVCAGEGGCGVSLGWCRCGDRKTPRTAITALGMTEVTPIV